MKFSLPSDHVTSCFVVSAVSGGRELFGPQSLVVFQPWHHRQYLANLL